MILHHNNIYYTFLDNKISFNNYNKNLNIKLEKMFHLINKKI